MALNRQIASILEQAAYRRLDLARATFRETDDCRDHREVKIDFTVKKKPKGLKAGARGIKEGTLEITDNDLDRTPGDILDKYVGKVNVGYESDIADLEDTARRDREFYLNNTLRELLETA
jgi:hypothetical protein